MSLELCRLPGLGSVAIRGLNAFARIALVRCVEHKERLTSEVRAGYLAPYDSWKIRIATLRFVQDIPMTPAHRSYADLERLGREISQFAAFPMLIVWGGKDFVFNSDFYDEWRRRFPEAQSHYLEDAGHYVLEDAHERIVPWMQSFLSEARA